MLEIEQRCENVKLTEKGNPAIHVPREIVASERVIFSPPLVLLLNSTS